MENFNILTEPQELLIFGCFLCTMHCIQWLDNLDIMLALFDMAFFTLKVQCGVLFYVASAIFFYNSKVGHCSTVCDNFI